MRLFLPYRTGLCLGHIGPFSAPFFPRLYLSEREREKHLYVLGITGKGKSKFIEQLIVQDILAGRGCGVIDPHSDLVRSVFRQLVTSGHLDHAPHIRRIVYVDVNDPQHLPAFNVLSVQGEPYKVAQTIIEAFRRTWPDALKEAPQFSNIMLAGLVVLIKTHHTLVDMQRLLTQYEWRETLLAQANDPECASFFHDRFDLWGRDAPSMIESTLNKVSAFTFNPTLKQMLGSRTNSINFRAIMDSQRVLLCDLGGDPETRRLLGSLFVTFLEYAAFSRQDIVTGPRFPWFLYMDEFQDFSANDGSSKTLAQILSEARKFGLHLTLAHQTLTQLHARLSGSIGNIQTKVLFGMSRQDAEVFGRSFGQVDTRAIKDSAKTDIQHPLYESLPEQWETLVTRLQWQRSRRATVIDHKGHTAQILTLPSVHFRISDDQVEAAREAVRSNFIKSGEQVVPFSPFPSNTIVEDATESFSKHPNVHKIPY